jgi:predicted O-methyltransferase YrrM
MGYPNWFEKGAIKYFDLMLPKRFANKPLIDILQIGTYTGDASEWLMENIITDKTSWLTDVDTWYGSEEEAHKELDWQEIEKYYDNRMSNYTNVCKVKGHSKEFLTNAPTDHYDFIYIDGDHTAAGVYSDATLAWKCLKQNGLMAFDDYRWTHDSGNIELSPKPGIDKFLKKNKDKYELLISDEQLWIFKK